ncbi:DeoR/GlpR family DNA-binding transcription regulator [Corynebacterium sp. Marseille-Q2823]|uniref:DeoR/GlpR family DNA-binding transcription regulator n=1 Tax=Corynebacterium sp. Marseille-Q2823 TaxID=2736606 RepID=UPI00158E99A7|nr:DeoR/GlpR family DNA-binding transcription regulator [Corynebacterium sp. Marseille-Q2823]
MIPDQRRRAILRILTGQGTQSIKELAELLNVSHMTIRRDISRLEEEGLVFGVAGGVRLAQQVNSAPTFDAKSLEDLPEKVAIGKAAAKFLSEDGTYYLDAGTTTVQLVPHLTALSRATVVTNDFAIVDELCGAGHIEVIHVGGHLDHRNRSSSGPLSELLLRCMAVDMAFISATSWDIKRGLTATTVEKVGVKNVAIDIAKSAILLAASSKYGTYSTYRVTDLARFDQIITDSGLGNSAAAGIKKSGIELHRAMPTK